jgi:uncharacterized protein (TIGR02145 family)
MKLEKNTKITILSLCIFLIVGVLIFVLIRGGAEEFFGNGNGDQSQEILFLEDVYDVDGNIYKTVKIGGQVWMAENLKTRHSFGESWCYNNQEHFCERYGRLYNWEAVMNGSVEPGGQGICPDGWHVPTDAEWYILESFFATGTCSSSRLDWGCSPAGALMKTESWGGQEENAFAVLPAGFIDLQGKSSLLNSYSYFWTSSKLGSDVWRRGFLDSQSNILRNTVNPEFGYSVRCIKD